MRGASRRWLLAGVVLASVALAPLLIVPTVHTPVPLLYVPWLGLEETKVRPAGSESATVTLRASLGPALPATRV